MRNWLVSFLLLLIGRRRPKPLGDADRVVPPGAEEPRAELAAIVLLALSSLCAIAFVVFYALDRLPNQTQLMGGAIGMCLIFIAAALTVTAKKLVVNEEIEDDYPVDEHPDEQEAIVQVVEESGSRLTRRRLFKLSLGAAGGALGLAAITPIASLGPVFDMKPFYDTEWRRGRRLVDERGKPWRADDIEANDFYTAFPEGGEMEALGAPLVVVRLKPDQIESHKAFAADGIVAFSKICTHAGCAISLYRAPLFQPDEPKPALVCPCHYSTFDPANGGAVTFGPAGRKLPMLPLRIDRQGYLRAAGNFDGPVGPSWWGVRMKKPNPPA